MKNKLVFTFLFFILVPLSLFADDFSFSAESMSGEMVKGREQVSLRGNAIVISGGLRIEADRMDLSGKDFRFVQCQGNVRVNDKERGIRLSTESLYYDRRDKIARLSGPSIMEDRENHLVIKGDYIEDDDSLKLTIIQINVRILKENLSCRAEFARYDRNSKILELNGAPEVVNKGDRYSASSIRVNIETEDIVMTGSVSGTVKSSEQKNNSGDIKNKKPGTEP